MFVLRFHHLALFCLLMILADVGRADEQVIKEEDRVVYQKKTLIDFSDVLISGELMKPDGAYVKNRKNTRFDALIELRSNFRAELMKTAGGL